MKEKIYKFFLALMVSLSLGSGSIAQNEIRKMLEVLSGTVAQVQELDEEETEPEENKKEEIPPSSIDTDLSLSVSPYINEKRKEGRNDTTN